MSEPTDQLGLEPAHGITPNGSNEREENVSQYRRREEEGSGAERRGARWAGCTHIGTLNIQVNDKVAEFSLEFCSIHQKQTILRDMRVVGTILRYTYGACSVISWPRQQSNTDKKLQYM